MSKKKKKSANINKTPKKKPVRKLPVIIVSVIAVAIISVLVITIVNSCSEQVRLSELYNYSWIPSSAHNSSGDEVELTDVYNTDHTSYQGSLTFNDDGTFSLWLSPGTPDDGTHSGTYSLTDDNKVVASFDEGTVTSFDIKRQGKEIENIIVYYDEYEVYFSKQ